VTRPSLNDRVAETGSELTTLHLSCTAADVTLTVHDASTVTVGSRVMVDTELMKVTNRNTGAKTLTVTRGVDSLAATHAADASVVSVDNLFSVVSEPTSIAGFLPPLRTPSRFVLLPKYLTVTSKEAHGKAAAGEEAWGSYQDGGGDSVQIERDGLVVSSRLGLLVFCRPEGGHWEMGVTRV
jgi:hypothetical protein